MLATEGAGAQARRFARGGLRPARFVASCGGFLLRPLAKDGKNIAVITDDRDDAPLQRPHVPIGTEIVIPNHKMKWDRGNPTGHNIIFLSNAGVDGRREVYCFVDGNGI